MAKGEIMKQCIFTTTAELIEHQRGAGAVQQYNGWLCSADIIKGDTANMSDQEQLVAINAFWRNLWGRMRDTLQLRTWLTTAPTAQAYLNSFDQFVIPLMVLHGVIQ